jgi:hypothetical protein
VRKRNKKSFSERKERKELTLVISENLLKETKNQKKEPVLTTGSFLPRSPEGEGRKMVISR